MSSEGSGTPDGATFQLQKKKHVHIPLPEDQKNSVMSLMGLFPGLEWHHILGMGIKSFLSFRPIEAESTLGQSMTQALFTEIQAKWGIDPVEVYLETLEQLRTRLSAPNLGQLTSFQLDQLREKITAVLDVVNGLGRPSKKKKSD